MQKYSAEEKERAAKQYSYLVQVRWSETGNAIEAFPSVGIDLQCELNRAVDLLRLWLHDDVCSRDSCPTCRPTADFLSHYPE